MFTTLGIYVTRNLGLGKSALGLVYAFNGALVLLLQWPALALIARHGVGRILVGSSLAFALGFALVGVAGGLAGVLVAIAGVTVGEVLFAPAHQAAAAAASDARRLGTGFGLVGFCQMIGVAFAPLLGGLLLDHAGARPGTPSVMVWSVIAALAVTMAAIFALQARLVARAEEARTIAVTGTA
jgi:MFS family permease